MWPTNMCNRKYPSQSVIIKETGKEGKAGREQTNTLRVQRDTPNFNTIKSFEALRNL
jgi:hypothetical protein